LATTSTFALDVPELDNVTTAAGFFNAIHEAGFSAGLAEAKDTGLEVATSQLGDFLSVATKCGENIATIENSEKPTDDDRACNVAASTSKIEKVCYADNEKVLWFHLKDDAHINLAEKNIALIPQQIDQSGNISISFEAGEVICITDATHPNTVMVSKSSNNSLIGELMGTGKSCLYVDFSVTNDAVTTALKTSLGMPLSFIAKYTNPDDNSIDGSNACNGPG